MQVNNISSTNFQAGVRIKSIENRHKNFLYNEVNDITKEYKIPANFRTHDIELPSVSKAILAKLNALGIKFSEKI